ncbi:MAG: STAS/SEC14 domain-containing protein [Candidatus Binatia bacterium]
MEARGGLGRHQFFNEHYKDIDKIAVVGDEKWKDLVYAFLAKGFRRAAVEYFVPGDLAKARAWLGADARQ